MIIDLPQAVDAAANNHARTMLERDVANMTTYYGQFAPELLVSNYAGEIWDLYESGDLNPDMQLTGLFEDIKEEADVDAVMVAIREALAEEQGRQLRKREAEEAE